MENNLKKLMNESDLSFRKLANLLDVCFDTLSKYARGRLLRQHNIAKLTAFFNCTADYLLKNSDMGVYVYLPKSIGDIDKVLISESQLARLMPHIKTEIIKVYDQPKSIKVFGEEIQLPTHCVHRQFKLSAIEDEEYGKIIMKPILINLINQLDESKLQKLSELIKIIL